MTRTTANAFSDPDLKIVSGDLAEPESYGQEMPDPAQRLSMAQRIALEALMCNVARAQQQLRDLFVEIGLDPEKRYSLQPDGTVLEQ